MPRRRRRSNSVKKAAIIAGVGAIGLAGLYLSKKNQVPKQGFVFTPAEEESGNNNCLLIIDPQNDFMEGGSLPVSGAKGDMDRLSNFIKEHGDILDSICVTLDTHSLFHIGNAHAYENKNGKDIQDTITPYDKEQHIPKQKSMTTHVIKYSEQLAKKGKTHVLWPLHCQLGTSGHNIYKPLYESLVKWSDKKLTEVRYIIKGCDTRYENFSVFRSAGVDSDDYSNPNKEFYKFNNDLAKHLYKFKNLYIAGEAKSHCVYDSTEDYINWVISNGNPKSQQIYIIENCMSDVAKEFSKDDKYKEMEEKYNFVHLFRS